MGTHFFNRHTTWTVFFSLVVALGLGACSDVSTAPATPAGPGPLAIATTSLPKAIQGQQYIDVLSGTGGQSPYTWSITPALPSGLQLDQATGKISGTPTGTSEVDYTFTLRDSSNPAVQVQKVLHFSVVPPPPVLTILTTTLPTGTINQTYSEPLQAAGGTGAVIWSVLAGALPTNFSLNPSTGVISGTPTGTTSSTSNFTVRVADTGGQIDDQALSITINLPPAPSITTTSLPGGTVGVAYNQQVQATGGTGSLTWSISAGTLPPPLTIHSGTGVISGSPSTPGTFTFTVQATDTFPRSTTQALSITIGATPIPPNIITTLLPGGTVGTAYSQTLQKSEGTGSVTWSVTGTLPPSLTLTPSTGVISGTPTAIGTFTFTPQVTDSLSLTDTTPPTLSITVANPPAPVITTTSLPGGTVGTAYNQTIQASGGTGTRVWSVISGSLPTNLTLSPTTGVISGSPGTPGMSSFTVQITDSLSLSDTQALSITIAAAPVPPNISTTSLPGGTVGTPYSQTLQLQSGTGTTSFTWSITDTLPTGLSLNTSTGEISGTPSATGTFNFTPHVTDSLSLTDTTPPALSIVISSSAPNITTTTLPDGIVGSAYSQTLVATGGAGTLVWSVTSGSLPTNLSLSTAGVLSGTPTGSATANFTVQVNDGFSQTDTQPLSLTIVAAATPLTITTATLPPGKVGDAYGTVTPTTPVTLAASGGTTPYTWSTIVTPPLPTGLSIDAAGTISGTPQAGTNGTTSHQFTVSDSTTGTANTTLSLTINP